ncbi:MAG: GrpB family protein [Alkalibacterium sp.]|nr:GrpB family protein [Alkalibacterium sp.]
MKLGLKRNEVRLVAHDNGWEEAFLHVKADIIKATGIEPHQIEHIGSTAIKEVMAKPVVDILVGVPSLEDDQTDFIKQLKDCGFYRLRVEKPDEIVLARFTDETFESKTHFIHLTQYKGPLWNDLLYFRDYLNTHQSVRKEYEEIKKAFVKEKAEGIAEYTDLKEEFVKRVLKNRP